MQENLKKTFESEVEKYAVRVLPLGSGLCVCVCVCVSVCVCLCVFLKNTFVSVCLCVFNNTFESEVEKYGMCVLVLRVLPLWSPKLAFCEAVVAANGG